MQKVLIITYYWPPSGGAGVQRWVKLSKYLSRIEIEPIVLTVDERYASYTQIDESLLKDIPEDIKVYKTKSFEPIRLYSRFVGMKNVPTAGFSNVDRSKKSLKLLSWLRSNLFIPDPRKGWNKYAFSMAEKIIKEENIRTVITTSPPNSTQLIGLRLRRELGIKWIADFRDPWTDIYYYDNLGHSDRSKRIDLGYEKSVINNADEIISVSLGVEESLKSKADHSKNNFHVVYNGFDPEDFEGMKIQKKENTFTILYTGSMADVYEPQVFFDAVKKVRENHPEKSIEIHMIGEVSKKIIEYIRSLELPLTTKPRVPHSEIIKEQKSADLLFLVIPHVENEKGILTGKVFEYIASNTPILCLAARDGEAGRIIEQGKFGKTFERDQKNEIFAYLENLIINDGKNEMIPDPRFLNKFSREFQAHEIKNLILGTAR